MIPSPRSDEIRIRPARREDAAALGRLSEQLGYPATAEVITARVDDISRDPSATLLVAELPSSGLAGFAQFTHQRLIESDPRVEVAALVVDESARGRGVGRLLLEHGEQWALERGCNVINLRSNVVRAAAHSFYECLGYRHYKTQKAFRKQLTRES